MEDFGPWLISSNDSRNLLTQSKFIGVSFKEEQSKPMKQVQIPMIRTKPLRTLSTLIKAKQPLKALKFRGRTKSVISPTKRHQALRQQETNLSIESSTALRRQSPIRSIRDPSFPRHSSISQSNSHIRKPTGSFSPIVELHSIISQSINQISTQTMKDTSSAPRILKARPARLTVVGVKQL